MKKSSLLYKDTEHASYMQIGALFRNYVKPHFDTGEKFAGKVLHAF